MMKISNILTYLLSHRKIPHLCCGVQSNAQSPTQRIRLASLIVFSSVGAHVLLCSSVERENSVVIVSDEDEYIQFLSFVKTGK